jgi:uncharacterized protein YbjT (DUF2867 family)
LHRREDLVIERRVVTIFGGSGFIGRTLIGHLAAADWIIRVAVRDTESVLALKTAGDVGQVVPVAADITDPASTAAAVAGATAVVNLVGILYQRGRQTFRRIHVDGAANVARAAREAGVKRLVQMSAIGADADAPAVYARTKAAGEAAAQREFPGASITRPSVVFGPDDNFFNQFAAMSRFMPALPVFPTRFQPVYVGDVAEAIARILARPETVGKTYQLGGPRVYTFRELMEIVLQATRRTRALIPLPLGLARLEAAFLEWLPVPPLTQDQVKLLRWDNVVGPHALTLSDLGIAPTAVEAIVPGYLARFRPVAKQARRAP